MLGTCIQQPVHYHEKMSAPDDQDDVQRREKSGTTRPRRRLQRMECCPEEPVPEIVPEQEVKLRACPPVPISHTSACQVKVPDTSECTCACVGAPMEGLDDVDGPFSVINRKEQSCLGKCPRHSIEQRLFRQDQSFVMNPEQKDHPLLSRTVRLPSTDSQDSPLSSPSSTSDRGLLCAFKKLFLPQKTPEAWYCPCDPVILYVQNPNLTGREPMGCKLQSFREGQKNRWCHTLKIEPFAEDSLANQLQLRDDDELLMINEEVVTRASRDQVREKIKYMLKTCHLTLLIRRVVPDHENPDNVQFKFVHIKAKIEATEIAIRVSENETVATAPAGRYYWISVGTSKRKIRHDGRSICRQGNDLIASNTDQEEVFNCTSVIAWDMQKREQVFFYLLQCPADSYYVETTSSGTDIDLRLSHLAVPVPVAEQSGDLDSRFLQYEKHGRDYMLQCGLNNGRYLLCKNSRLEISDERIVATDYRDYTAFRIQAVD